MEKQIREHGGASSRRTVPVDLSYTRPPMDDKEKDDLLKAAAVVPAYYASNVRIRTSVHDISFVFSRSIPADTSGAEADKPACIVSMSPALMMSMYRILEKHVGIYKDKYGDLPDHLKFEEESKEGDDAS